MRRSLLNKLNTPKALRQALVLFTMLLLPSTAWGEVTYTSTFQIGQSGSSNECMAKETTDNFSYNWKSNLGISQGDHLTIDANTSYSLVSAYRILGSVNSIVVRGSGLVDGVNISYSQTPDGGSPTQIGSLSFNGETNTYTLSSVNASLNSSYLCLSFKGGTSGGNIYSIEVTFKPVLRVGNYVFDAPGTIDDGKIVFQIDNDNNRILMLNNASIEGNIEWGSGYDLKLKISGINRITNIASDASSNYAIKSSGNALNIMQYSDASTTTDALILASYTSDTHENATYLITGFINTGVYPLISFENSDDNNIKYKCYTTSDNVFGLTVGDRKVHNIPNLVGHKEDVLGDGKVSFDGTNTLTLNNAALSKNILWSNQDADFTVNLIGSNSISIPQGSPCISSGYSRTLSFTRGDTNNPCSLTLLSEATIDVFNGFSNASSPTVTGLYWIPNKVENTGKISSATVKTLLGGGDGSENSPFIISTYEHLKDFATYVNNGTLNTEHVKLADDLENGILNCSGMTDFEPIGNGSKQFKGTFDGNNKTISNLSIINVNSKDVGLFGYNDGTIKNLTLSSCTISGGSSSSPSYIGALAGENAGSISGCTVKECTVSCNEDSSNPFVGGVVGILHGSITNCVVENTSVNAVTSDVSASVSTAYAGGIAGSRSNNTISGCTVKGTTTVTADYSNCSTDVFAGAIVGILQGQGTFTDNTYESTVTTKAKKQGDSDYTTKSGQTQRGIGDGDDVIGQVELAGTKKVTVEIISFAGSNWSCNAVEGTYYTYTSTSTNYIYYVLPGCDFTYSMKPENGRKPAFALSDNTIKVTAVEKTVNGAYDHTEFTFTMPNADLEVTRSFPIDLAAISADNFSIDNANYTGEAIVPTTVKVKGAPGSANFTRELKKDEDFTIKGYKLNGESVDSPVDIGTYTVTIEGTGNYIGTQDVSYEIIKAYALKINGTQLNAKNIDDFYGNGTVKFTPATETEPTNTLTLNGASVTGAIESGLGNLTIKLIGSNTIQGNGSSLITSLNGGTLTFDSDGTTISLLEFKDASGNVFPNDPISGFAEVKYGWVEYVESKESKKVCSWDIEILKNGTSYRIYDGNKDHILGEGDESVKYSHDATNGHVITLNNAEVNCIWTDIHADITIALNGTNRVIDTGGTYAIYSNNGKINFVKAEGATSVELTATCGNGYVPIAYGSITLGEGLYWKPFYADANATVKSTVITDDPEFIIIEDYVMTDDRSIETAITYDSTKKILTFNQYAGALTSQIKTGVQGLTIKLKGTSTVAASSLDYPFKAMTNTASILFDGENDSETGSLVMETNSDSAPFEGFAEGAITYNKVVYSRDDGGNNIHTIKAPTAPTMSLDNEKVKLTKDYDDGTIYYSIAYADDTPSETGVKYSEPFAITHPGVVTAWVEANNATTSTVTGKHFAYQNAPYTMAINGIKTPTLLPTIAEGDVISLQRYASEDEDIASFIDGLITAKKPGTVTLSAILMPGDNTPFKVLNPVSDPNAPNEHTVSFSVYVGENLSNYFEGSNEFGTFYNEDSEIYAVPQGMKAYVVTGVSGSKLVTVETTVLPPNTVVLLDKAEGISFTKVPSEGAAPGGNLLKHATADISVTTESSLYVLYNDMYVKATAGSPIPSGKNYLDLSPTTNAGTRGFYNIIGEDDGSTGISEVKSEGVNSEKWNGEWFDLQGRRLPAQPTKPGLYIHKDKKVVIK